MNWKEITSIESVNLLKQESQQHPEKAIVIFKHSTRCGTSRMAKNLFESQWNISEQAYLINVVESRAASNSLESVFGIPHESPQVLVIKNGVSIYDNSHDSIDAEEVIKLMQSEPA